MLVHGVWMRRTRTAEGEEFMAIETCTFNDYCHRHVWMPITYLHTIDAHSPLFDYLSDVRRAPGTLLVYVQGYDEILKTSICNRASYPLKHTGYGRWHDIIVSSPSIPGNVDPWHTRFRTSAEPSCASSLSNPVWASGLPNTSPPSRHSCTLCSCQNRW